MCKHETLRFGAITRQWTKSNEEYKNEETSLEIKFRTPDSTSKSLYVAIL